MVNLLFFAILDLASYDKAFLYSYTNLKRPGIKKRFQAFLVVGFENVDQFCSMYDNNFDTYYIYRNYYV
ncbi:hypothetical protein FORC13_p060 (plasmid) [Bacillus cereus]|nr:hypothetical protein FORC13_p060 [Bacillus cereus]